MTTGGGSTAGLAGSNFDDFHIQWSDPDRYEILSRVGGGRYSEVFLGLDMVNNDSIVVKVLKPVAAKKIKREIKVLRTIRGGPNVVQLLDVVRDPSRKYHSLVMEAVDAVEWRQLYPNFTEWDIKHYTFQLLKALAFCHSRGIMHRDVKPGNLMIDPRRRICRLIDWGLAEFYEPGTEYHLRVGSRYYKGPELLVGYKTYDYSLDLWSVGCMFASMIFRYEHFFKGSDNDDQLFKIMKTLGTEEFDEYLTRHGIQFETEHNFLLETYPPIPWSRFVAPGNTVATPEAQDLLSRLLRYDHQKRLTALEAQSHAFFNSVRLESPRPIKGEFSDSGFYST
ncbi:kinase-like domain-containing protein [Flagelloscypha sp. PMI_526]|nr:kinase-like domain-containing protein [Flagelloscypha sp. PMI_526]